MRLDPFRIQILTLSLDSQIVLTLVGLVVAGLVVRQAARHEGLGVSAGHWWDLVFAAVVGARLVWVITHAGYYLRQPLQAVVVLEAACTRSDSLSVPPTGSGASAGPAPRHHGGLSSMSSPSASSRHRCSSASAAR